MFDDRFAGKKGIVYAQYMKDAFDLAVGMHISEEGAEDEGDNLEVKILKGVAGDYIVRPTDTAPYVIAGGKFTETYEKVRSGGAALKGHAQNVAHGAGIHRHLSTGAWRLPSPLPFPPPLSHPLTPSNTL